MIMIMKILISNACDVDADLDGGVEGGDGGHAAGPGLHVLGELDTAAAVKEEAAHVIFVNTRVRGPAAQAQVILLPVRPAAANLNGEQLVAIPMIIEIPTIRYMLSRKCSLAEMLFV